MIALSVRLPPGYRLHAYPRLASTNDEARRLLRAGDSGPSVIWARAQTAGRGRDGRCWESPPGNLYVSVMLRPAGGPGVVAQLGFAMALAVRSAIGAALGSEARVGLKWPNDVLVERRKIAGILLESEGPREGAVDGLILGVGINIASHPAEARMPATDLRSEGASVSIEGVLGDLLLAFDLWHRRWVTEGFGPVRAAWLTCALGRGERMLARLPRELIEGTFADLDPKGGLVLLTRAGPRVVVAGDVFLADAPG
jgi:BirA family biotin operon repressor/biotin-[acetyl-CoA-carboxylase] ligase